MYKIIALFGEAGSGKDYLFNQLKEEWSDVYNFVIPWTSRPPRSDKNENYHFKKDEDFNKTEFLTLTSFNNWFYGYPENIFSQSVWNIGIFNIQMIQDLKYNDKCECVPIFIKAPIGDRLERQLCREMNPNIQEISRRALADRNDFLDIPFLYFVVKNGEKDRGNSLQNLIRIINLITIF